MRSLGALYLNLTAVLGAKAAAYKPSGETLPPPRPQTSGLQNREETNCCHFSRRSVVLCCARPRRLIHLQNEKTGIEDPVVLNTPCK